MNDALTAWQTSLSKSELLDKQVASLQTAARSTSLLMEHGNTTYLEVLTARQTLLNAQLAQTANRFSEIQSLINLYKALGEVRNRVSSYYSLCIFILNVKEGLSGK